MRRFPRDVVITLLLFTGCNTVVEQTPMEISLSEEATAGEPEYSGLAWYGDNLVLLPQYPDRFPGRLGGNLLTVPRDRILAYLDGGEMEPIVPEKVAFDDDGVMSVVPGFEGYEAVVFVGDRIFLTIEAKEGEGRRGYIVAGSVNSDRREIHLEGPSLREIALDTLIFEMSFETLVQRSESLITFYEANGRTVTPSPKAPVFDLRLNVLEQLSIPSVEYRITDATAISGDGSFWAINYFYPGDENLKPLRDPISEAYGEGRSHSRRETVERLIQFSFQGNSVVRVERPPVQLSLLAGESRNWEGIVTLDDRGFLIITDTYPRTIFAFVPFPID